MKAVHFTTAEIEKQRAHSGRPYQEFIRSPFMSAGLYVLPAGSSDLQRPHNEDEMYYVIRGKARFRCGDDDLQVSAGSMIFVAAERAHHFHEISEDLTVLVFFAPAET